MPLAGLKHWDENVAEYKKGTCQHSPVAILANAETYDWGFASRTSEIQFEHSNSGIIICHFVLQEHNSFAHQECNRGCL